MQLDTSVIIQIKGKLILFYAILNYVFDFVFTDNFIGYKTIILENGLNKYINNNLSYKTNI